MPRIIPLLEMMDGLSQIRKLQQICCLPSTTSFTMRTVDRYFGLDCDDLVVDLDSLDRQIESIKSLKAAYSRLGLRARDRFLTAGEPLSQCYEVVKFIDISFRPNAQS